MQKKFEIISKGEMKSISGKGISDTLIVAGNGIIFPRLSIAGTPATQSCSNFGTLPSACDNLK
ncbi:MAG: hypothetical protein LBT27_01350 [Prevotellaceae bacterium]|jgi:hypothetical protein|nr:hypothetical protein [Prevotellaceae bacterium]